MRKLLLFMFITVTTMLAACSQAEVQEENPIELPSTQEVETTQTPTTNPAQEVPKESQVSDPLPENSVPSAPEQLETLEIELDAFNFGYSQKEIKAKVGQTIRVVMTNTGGNHDFVIDEFNVKTPVISTGDTTTAEFTVTEKGSFEYYCSVGSHRALGMWGTLIVE